MMLEFKKELKKSLAKKKLISLSMSSFTIKQIEYYFKWKIKVSWAHKNWILFIKVNPVFAKVEIFKYKQELIEYINKKLDNFWYKQKIKDIMIKN